MAQGGAVLGGKRYRVDAQASEVRLLVYRDGPMARFGHNHVIVGRPNGEIGVADNAAASGFTLDIPLDSFIVDPPAPRAEEGADFAAEVSDAAREGTKKNMLDAARFPSIRIESISMAGPRWNPTVSARVSVQGGAREISFPAAVLEQDGVLTVIATFRIVQSELGVRPFTVLGGAIQVRDAVDVRVRVVARPAGRG